jgi:putative ABC transport system permease protein
VGIGTLPQRLGSASVIVLGIAGVVGVLVALLAMAGGFQSTLRATGRDDTVIVLRAGARTELNSVVDHDIAQIVSEAPQIQRDAHGAPVASPEIVVVASLPERGSGLDANVEIRGLGERAWDLLPDVRITAGRRFHPGMHELIAGRRAHQQFRGVDVGESLRLNGQQWTIIGLFESGDAHDSELWGDTDSIAATYRRGSSTSSVSLRLASVGALAAYKAFIANDPRLKVDVQTTRDYYTAQSASLAEIIRTLGTTVGVIMAIGAVCGALNSMYAAVAGRTREIATLRAIGFPAVPVIVSVLLEAMLLAAAGGGVGAALARLIFNGYTTSTLGANFSQVVFTFSVSPPLLWTGLRWALAIGLIGGAFPALHAARLPVTQGLRQL